jgi:peroxiredoxin
MKKSVFVSLILVLVVLSVVAGIYVNRLLLEPAAPAAPVARALPELRPDFSLPDLQGELRQAAEWDGQVLLINFWATWCPPCIREIPAFIRLQETYQERGFTIIGIAIDTQQNVVDFIDPMGVNFPILMGDQAGIELAKAYGNRHSVLPYSVVVDRQGRIVFAHRNELSFDDAEQVIKPLL